MKFGNPLGFTLLLLPLGVVLVHLVRNRCNYGRVDDIKFIQPDLLASVLPDAPSKRRFVPAVMGLLAMVLLTAVVARPLDTMRVPENRSSVMIVLDNSTSMLAKDIEPTRLDAAKMAIRQMVEAAPADLNIGLVTFAANAVLRVPPTQNRVLLLEKLDTLVTEEGGTRTGEGVMTALAALDSFAITGEGSAIEAQLFIISDGAETPVSEGVRGLQETTAAVKKRGYQINAVAYGTEDGFYLDSDGNALPALPEFESLEQAATATGGVATEAPSQEELSKALASVPEATSYTEIEILDSDTVLALVSAALVLGFVAAVLVIFREPWFHNK